MKNVGTIVLVEDNADDAFLIERRLRKHGIGAELKKFGAASMAKEFLDGIPSKDLPRIMLLSVNLNREDPFAFINQVRQSDHLKNMLIVAVGNSERPDDIQKAYDLGANAYFTRKIGFEQLAETIKTLEFVEDVS